MALRVSVRPAREIGMETKLKVEDPTCRAFGAL